MSKPKRKRRTYSVEQKAAIIRRHLIDKVPVSDLCDEYKMQPSVFYSWQKQLMDRLPEAFAHFGGARPSNREAVLKQRVAELEAKLARKDQVIAGISEEFVTLKKGLGEP
jgi:transposase